MTLPFLLVAQSSTMRMISLPDHNQTVHLLLSIRLHAEQTKCYSANTDTSPRHLALSSQFPACWQSAQVRVADKRIIISSVEGCLFWSTSDSTHWTSQPTPHNEILECRLI